MLKLIDITKQYKVDEESILALHGVDIEFRKNEFVSILGPSGCGKTTLLNIIGGLDRYTSGDIQIEGISTKQYDDVDWDTYRNRRIGFVFQSYNLIPHLSVMKNVSMSLTLAGINKEESRLRTMEALRKVGLEDQARKKPNQLSGGQMQRVAIARALVNNPEIILADEPTGALDSESGLQVMDLLKEVAEDRLVIMVTHNPAIAEQFSTRIVYLKDGEVVGDTMPYNACEENSISQMKLSDENTNVSVDGEADDLKLTQTNKNTESVCNKNKNCGRFKRYREKLRAQDKASMKISTAVSLSFTNLLSKKGRTFLTSIAGSIGIIGIILVMSLSMGVDKYVTMLEENALSQYPIQINESNFDISSALKLLTDNTNSRPDFPSGDKIYVQGILSNILGNIDQMSGENDLAGLKKYIDGGGFDETWGQVKYDYGTNFNVYSKNVDSLDSYMKVHPFKDAMGGIMGGIGDLEGMGGALGELTQYAYMLDAWDELSTSKALLDQQYDILGDGRWPTDADEIVIVLDQKNQINDYALFMLGLITPDEVKDAFNGKLQNKTFTVEQLMNLTYEVMPNTTYITEIGENQWNMPSWSKRAESSIEFVEQNSKLSLKVTGVVRPKKGSVVTSINSVVGYTHELTKEMIGYADSNDAVNYFKELVEVSTEGGDLHVVSPFTCIFPDPTDKSKNVELTAGKTVIDKIEIANELLREMGVVDLNQPTSIRIYSSTFEDKDKITKFLSDFEKQPKGSKVHYTDYLEMMMGFVKTMTKTVTGALLGFSAISLVVSTIMIAIIIYTSVLERRKEIGVLRSLGARKKDVSRVFLAESAMIGAYSGIIGLIFSALISVVGNVIIKALLNLDGIMALTWWHCLLMFSISVLLSMFAGFIPSRIAAKKDPAIALRTE